MKKVLMASMLCAGFAGAASAQFAITPGGQNSGNGWFSGGAIPGLITGSGGGGANFTGTTSGGTDNVFAAWWFFRGQGDTREFAFGNGASGNVSVSGFGVGDLSGSLDTGGYDFFANSTGNYTFSSEQRWQIFNPNNTPNADVQVIATNKITNTGSTAASLSLFYYMDFDLQATSVDHTASLLGTNYMQVSALSTTADWAGYGADAWQVTAWPGLTNQFSNATVENLNNTGLPFGPADFTGAFQWDINLAPGQSITLMSGFTLNGAAVPAPGALALLGLAGLAARRRRRA